MNTNVSWGTTDSLTGDSYIVRLKRQHLFKKGQEMNQCPTGKKPLLQFSSGETLLVVGKLRCLR